MVSCCWKALPEVQSQNHRLPLSAPAGGGKARRGSRVFECHFRSSQKFQPQDLRLPLLAHAV